MPQATELQLPAGAGLDVRRAGPGEVAACVPLFLAYRDFYAQPCESAAAQRFLTERLQRGQAQAWLAWRGQEALGFALCYPSFCSLLLAPIVVLNDLFTTPTARGQGVARALMQAVEAHARATGVQRMDLSTAHSNHTAQALYRSQGWLPEAAFQIFSKGLAQPGAAGGPEAGA